MALLGLEAYVCNAEAGVRHAEVKRASLEGAASTRGARFLRGIPVSFGDPPVALSFVTISCYHPCVTRPGCVLWLQVKVNDFCEFPMELDMRPYTREGLLDGQGAREGGSSSFDGGRTEGSEGVAEAATFPDSYYMYKLAGVVVHSGTSEFGHYYSFIKGRKSQVQL